MSLQRIAPQAGAVGATGPAGGSGPVGATGPPHPVQSVIKASDEARASSPTYADDAELVLTLTPGTYLIHGFILYNRSGSFRATLLATGGASDPQVFQPGGASQAYGTGVIVTQAAFAADLKASWSSILRVTTTTVLSVQWSQVTTNVTASTMYAGSQIVAVKLD